MRSIENGKALLNHESDLAWPIQLEARRYAPSCIGFTHNKGYPGKMTVSTYDLTFKGELLSRGFWLYVWEITTPKGTKLY
jgi:hypothetical protein